MGFGNSVSAINISYLCQEGFSGSSFENLEKMWWGVTDTDVFSSWLVPWVPSLWRGGLNSIAPLRRFLSPYFDVARARRSRSHAWVSALNLNTGRMEFGCSSASNFLEWVLASSAHPIWFEPVQIDGHWYTDGGVTDVTPVKEAIRRGARDLLVFLHSTEGEDAPQVWGERDGAGGFRRPGIIGRTMRELDLALGARLEDDVKVAEWINWALLEGVEHPALVGKHYIDIRVIRPRRVLDVSMPHFRPEDSQRLFRQGYEDALAQVG